MGITSKKEKVGITSRKGEGVEEKVYVRTQNVVNSFKYDGIGVSLKFHKLQIRRFIVNKKELSFGQCKSFLFFSKTMSSVISFSLGNTAL